MSELRSHRPDGVQPVSFTRSLPLRRGLLLLLATCVAGILPAQGEGQISFPAEPPVRQADPGDAADPAGAAEGALTLRDVSSPDRWLGQEVRQVRWALDGSGVCFRWHPDPDRLSMYGVSYGGFFTLLSLFRYPGVFAAGVSNDGVTDWAHYSGSSSWRRTSR